MKSILFMLTFFSVYSIEAQQRDFAVKLSILPLFDFYGFPTINLGVENKLTDNLSWYNELGVKYRKSDLEVSIPKLPKSYGFKGVTELRYYFRRNFRYDINNIFTGSYGVINMYASRLNYNGELVYYPNARDTTHIPIWNTITENFSVKRTVFTGNLLFGSQQLAIDNTLIDFFFGFGFRIKGRTYVGKKYDSKIDELDAPVEPSIQSRRNIVETQEGFTTTANFIFGIRLGGKTYH